MSNSACVAGSLPSVCMWSLLHLLMMIVSHKSMAAHSKLKVYLLDSLPENFGKPLCRAR